MLPRNIGEIQPNVALTTTTDEQFVFDQRDRVATTNRRQLTKCPRKLDFFFLARHRRTPARCEKICADYSSAQLGGVKHALPAKTGFDPTIFADTSDIHFEVAVNIECRPVCQFPYMHATADQYRLKNAW